MKTKFNKLWENALTNNCNLVQAGFGEWEIVGNKYAFPELASKAISLGFKIKTQNDSIMLSL